MTEATSLHAVIGRNVRDHREGQGLTQDALTRALRSGGLTWTRSTLAKVERGERPVTVEELVVLSVVTGVPVPDLVGGDDRVELAPDTFPTGDEVASVLAGQVASSDPRTVPGWGMTPDEISAVDNAAAVGEPEVHAAQRLGVDAIEVVRAARRLWGRTLAAERDSRVAGRIEPDADARSRQAVRGHITRGLLAELRDELERETERERKKR